MTHKLSEKLLNKQFEQIPTTFLSGKTPSYGKAEVEKFLQEASVEAELLEKQVKEAERKREILETQKNYSYQFKGASEEELTQIEKELSERSKAVARMEKSFTRMVVVAEEQAEEIRSEAYRDKDDILKQAEKVASELVLEAQRRRDEAAKEAELILTNANNRQIEIANRYDDIKQELKTIYALIGDSISLSEKTNSVTGVMDRVEEKQELQKAIN